MSDYKILAELTIISEDYNEVRKLTMETHPQV
jgi:hypothetical protein